MDPKSDEFYYADNRTDILATNVLFEKIIASQNSLTSEYILDHKRRLKKILENVSYKVSERILQNQLSCISELQRIMNLQKSITDSVKICAQARSYLKAIKEGPARNGTTIVEHYKRRKSLDKLLESLTSLNELRKSIFEIRELIICHEDFSRALEVYRNCRAKMETFKYFKCATELDKRLNDTIKLIGDQVGIVLSRLCSSYNPETYVKLQALFSECSNSEDLRDYVTKQALDFFNRYHKSSIDELKMFLENELWERLPVKHDFKLVQLKEFSFLRSPNDDDCEFDLELELDYLDEEEYNSNDHHYLLTGFPGPVLTNSSLNVLRLFGRYIHMMNVLEPISYEILLNIYKLLDYYTIFVFKRFGPHKDQDLQSVIRSIRESLINSSTTLMGDETKPTIDSQVTNISTIINSNLAKIPVGHGCGIKQSEIEPDNKSVQNDDLESISTEYKKAVAIESLIFLVNQLWNLQEYLETLIPSRMQPHLREQFSKSNSIIPDFLKARAEICSDIIWNG